MSHRDSTRSIKGLMPNSLEMARDSSSSDTAFSPVARLVSLEQGVRVIAAGPGQFGLVVSFAADGPNWFAQLGLRKGGLRSSRDQAEPSG